MDKMTCKRERLQHWQGYEDRNQIEPTEITIAV
jgi:hypothetical protein